MAIYCKIRFLWNSSYGKKDSDSKQQAAAAWVGLLGWGGLEEEGAEGTLSGRDRHLDCDGGYSFVCNG